MRNGQKSGEEMSENQEYEDDPNANYTGWELPEHPGLRAWIETLPPLTDESLYRADVARSDGSRAEYLMLMVINEEEAIESFDLMFLAAHTGEYGQDVEAITLWSPERNGKRYEISTLTIESN
jgi:hypothetical protein